jgi:hypothetical protein
MPDDAIDRLRALRDAKNADPSVVELARVVRVGGYRRRGVSGGSEHVDSYVRKQLDGWSGGGHTKTGAVLGKGEALKAETGNQKSRANFVEDEPEPSWDGSSSRRFGSKGTINGQKWRSRENQDIGGSNIEVQQEDGSWKKITGVYGTSDVKQHLLEHVGDKEGAEEHRAKKAAEYKAADDRRAAEQAKKVAAFKSAEDKQEAKFAETRPKAEPEALPLIKEAEKTIRRTAINWDNKDPDAVVARFHKKLAYVSGGQPVSQYRVDGVARMWNQFLNDDDENAKRDKAEKDRKAKAKKADDDRKATRSSVGGFEDAFAEVKRRQDSASYGGGYDGGAVSLESKLNKVQDRIKAGESWDEVLTSELKRSRSDLASPYNEDRSLKDYVDALEKEAKKRNVSASSTPAADKLQPPEVKKAEAGLKRAKEDLAEIDDPSYTPPPGERERFQKKVAFWEEELKKAKKKSTVKLSAVDQLAVLQLSADERDLVIELAGRLDFSPKKNWVENAGGLPKFIEDIAIALIRDHGMTRSRAIATAVNRVKKWAAGVGDTKPDTKAKAAAAVAQWEALKAKNKAKGAVK